MNYRSILYIFLIFSFCFVNFKLLSQDKPDSTFNGLKIDYYKNGNLKNKVEYKNGSPMGLTQMYDTNGVISESGFWMNNRWVANYTLYYKNGQPMHVFNFNDNGKRVGLTKYYHENGIIAIIGSFVNGREQGAFIEFDKNGKKKGDTQFYSDGKKTDYYLFNRSSKKMTLNFDDDEKAKEEIEQYLIEYVNTENNNIFRRNNLLKAQSELTLKNKEITISQLENNSKKQEIELLNKNRELSNYELLKTKKEKELEKQNFEKQEIARKATIEKEQFQKLLFGLFAGFILIVAFLIFLNLQKNKKQNKLITEQKHELEHKKQEITDSINYSKRIQTAILPDLNDIKQSLTDFFILYQPKDIVSGDFYYFNKVNNDVFMAAADCTGHGVPGAFMSLVGSKELKIANAMTNSPAQILKHLNNGVKDTLRQNHIDGTKDGMDIALVRINGTTVRYSAANRPLWILKKDSNVIEEIKATKTAIAGFTEDDFEFEEHEINLAKGDTIYLFSDGYADQFGGDKQKKMTTKRFREFVLSIKDKSMHEQQLQLESFFNSWQGNTEQVDDLLVIGIRL